VKIAHVDEPENTYEARHGWTRHNLLIVIGSAVFVACIFLPLWTGRVRVDGILMPAAFLPVVRVLDGVAFGIFLAIGLWRAGTRQVVLRVDPTGITFGTGRKPSSVIGWTEIYSVELFTSQVQTGRRSVTSPFVGVYRPAAAPPVTGASKRAGRRTIPTPHGQLVAASRAIAGIPFDQERFATAVRRNSPNIPVNATREFAAAI
jgi:hypothetical protein